jgi:hypothetical protein
MSTDNDNPAAIAFDIWGTNVPAQNPVLERIEASLKQLADLRMDIDKRAQILGADGKSMALVRGPRTRSAPIDPSLIVQCSPNQMPIPVQAAPAGAASYQYYGYTTASTGFTSVATPFVEIVANTTAPSIVSSSANDSIAGTGIRKVVIMYYDQNLIGPFFVVVNMNGVTPVNFGARLPHPLCYVEAVYGIEFGSLFQAGGNIVVWSAAGATGTQIATLNAADTQAAMCKHYVARGMTTYLTNMSLSLANAGNVLGFVAGTPQYNGLFVAYNITGTLGGAQGFQANFPTPIPIVGPARLLMRGFTDVVTTGTMWGTMGFYDLPTPALANRQAPYPTNPTIPAPYTLITP